MHSMNDEEWKAYSKQLDESQGFDVGEFPNVFHYGLIQPMSFEGDDEDLIYFTNLGIAHYNEKEVASLKLVEILKVNAQACSPFNFYITFEAKDASTGERGTYQTKVYGRCPIKSSYVDFTRVKPETKPEVPAAPRPEPPASLHPSLPHTNSSAHANPLPDETTDSEEHERVLEFERYLKMGRGEPLRKKRTDPRAPAPSSRPRLGRTPPYSSMNKGIEAHEQSLAPIEIDRIPEEEEAGGGYGGGGEAERRRGEWDHGLVMKRTDGERGRSFSSVLALYLFRSLRSAHPLGMNL
ncbi:hypothetical protein CRG98_040806 [Punica granatum]|uniref:Cystatin domain-containing protein n=1 Tax=Punica granatum TaxID=22663 RepID=A0A2I0I4B8_PUNGR|nr:hypothetical protein CRG98_040806 [Punica granatum]